MKNGDHKVEIWTADDQGTTVSVEADGAREYENTPGQTPTVVLVTVTPPGSTDVVGDRP